MHTHPAITAWVAPVFFLLFVLECFLLTKPFELRALHYRSLLVGLLSLVILITGSAFISGLFEQYNYSEANLNPDALEAVSTHYAYAKFLLITTIVFLLARGVMLFLPLQFQQLGALRVAYWIYLVVLFGAMVLAGFTSHLGGGLVFDFGVGVRSE